MKCWYACYFPVKGQVPGSVHMDLFRADVIGDPYYRFNDVAYSWISYSDWSYTKTFTGKLLDVFAITFVSGNYDVTCSLVLYFFLIHYLQPPRPISLSRKSTLKLNLKLCTLITCLMSNPKRWIKCTDLSSPAETGSNLLTPKEWQAWWAPGM